MRPKLRSTYTTATVPGSRASDPVFFSTAWTGNCQFLIGANGNATGELRRAHLDAQSLRLVAAGHDAAIVIAQHHNRPRRQPRPKQPLTRSIEIVAINQCEHTRIIAEVRTKTKQDYSGAAFYKKN